MSTSPRSPLEKLIKHPQVRKAASRWYARPQRKFASDMSFTQAAHRFTNRNDLHAYFHHYFHRLCPPPIRSHRSYFSSEARGFGEDALHAMWYVLLREFKPRYALEIGVYRGQVISLWALIANCLNFEIEVHGISPFEPIGDSVSEYKTNIDYMSDTLDSFYRLGLPNPILLRALSTESAAATHIGQCQWDLIYIDGSHDYDVVLADYALCVTNLRQGGLLVMDDASLETGFRPPPFSFAGHPGPSRVARERATYELTFLGAVGHNNVFLKSNS
jgi:Methyltransferase domain